MNAQSIELMLRAELPAARRGLELLVSGLRILGESGLGYDGAQAESMARAMFPVLDLEGLPVG